MKKFEDLSFVIEEDAFMAKESYLKAKKFSSRLKQLNLLIIMDITGSMAKWIDSARNSILQIVKKIEDATESMTFQVGFVGYRDFGDTEQFVIQDFTPNVKQVQKTLKSAKATGGGDSAEDVIGAVRKGLQLTHNNGILQIFLVCDAPSHGSQYYEGNYSDNFKEEVKKGELEDEFKKFKNLGYLDCHLECFKIRDSTNLMFKKIGEAWGKNFNVTDYLKPEDFAFRVVDTVISSILTTEASIRSSQQAQQKKAEKLEEFEEIQASFDTIEFPALKEFSDSEKRKYWSDLFREELTTLQGKTSVKIEKKHFAEGATCYTHRMYDVRRKKMMVCKIPKSQDLNEWQKLESAQQQFMASAFCFQLSRYFRKIFKDQKNIPPIFYLTPYIYTLDEQFKGAKYVYAEPNIDFEGIQWKKFTNNYEISKSTFLASFSHFTFAMTAGYLMVTDIQGVVSKGTYFLSDPAILCPDEESFTEATNQGAMGFYAFFSEQHPICSYEICSALKIGSARMDIDEMQSTKLRESFIEINEGTRAEKVPILCYFCDETRQVDSEFYSSDRFHKTVACRKCRSAKQLEQFKPCTKCKKVFSFSSFFYKKLGLTLPSICPSCKSMKHYKCKECILHKTKQFCTTCDDTFIYLDCLLCEKKTSIYVHDDLENVYCAECRSEFPKRVHPDWNRA